MTSQHWLYLTNCSTDFDFFCMRRRQIVRREAMESFVTKKNDKMQRTVGNFPLASISHIMQEFESPGCDRSATNGVRIEWESACHSRNMDTPMT